MPPPDPKSRPPPGSRCLAALGVLPLLALAAFGFYALRRETALSLMDAQAQAATLAQAAAETLATAALTVPLPSAPDLEAWIARPGPPETEPLSRLQHLRPGILARFTSPQGTYPPERLSPVFSTNRSHVAAGVPPGDRLPGSGSRSAFQNGTFSPPLPFPAEPGSPLARQWHLAAQSEAADGPSVATALAWQATFDLARGQPFEPLARFRLGATLGRLGQVTAARSHLESLLSPPTPVAGETGLPLDVLACRALLQIADADPEPDSKTLMWLDLLAQRVLLHWRLPEALLLESNSQSPERVQRWLQIAELHDRTREAFLRPKSSLNPSPPTWSNDASTEAFLFTSHSVEGGLWHVRWPEATLREGIAAAGRIQLPAYFGLSLTLADRTFSPAISGEPLATANASAFPALTVTLTLAHPEILDARQRRKTWVFGSLILLATLTTLAAYLAALRASERQRQLALQQTEFVAAVSHELRAPLAAVRLLAEELIDLPADYAPRREEYHRLILREARRLGLLVDNVLRHSRLERRGPEIEPVRVDLVRLVTAAVEALQPTATERDVSLKVKLPDAPIEAVADPQAITQILVNLIDNALKHAPQQSVVTISLSHSLSPLQRERALLEVQDQGPGIPAADHARIFEAFVRRGTELRRETPGVGLGLAIVHRLVDAHRGRIQVDSPPGQGARFTVELPLNAGDGPGNDETPTFKLNL